MTQKNELYCGDVLEVLNRLDKSFDAIIADPPDNIGLKYNSYSDKLTDRQYKYFLTNCIDTFTYYSDMVWISFNSKWIFTIGSIVESFKEDRTDWDAKLFINTFTFGQNNRRDCGSGFRPLLRLKYKDAKLYPDAIKVPSWRQENGDKRAAAGGRVPLDVWDFQRITGNCKERRDWHPTQLREGMIKRIVDFSTVPGDSIFDAFSGTGTVLRTIKDRNITSVELDRFYCEQIAQEHGLKIND